MAFTTVSTALSWPMILRFSFSAIVKRRSFSAVATRWTGTPLIMLTTPATSSVVMVYAGELSSSVLCCLAWLRAPTSSITSIALSGKARSVR